LIVAGILNGCACLDVLGCNIPCGDVNSCFWHVLFFVRYTLGEDCETEASFDANRASVYSKRSLCSVILEPLFEGGKRAFLWNAQRNTLESEVIF